MNDSNKMFVVPSNGADCPFDVGKGNRRDKFS